MHSPTGPKQNRTAHEESTLLHSKKDESKRTEKTELPNIFFFTCVKLVLREVANSSDQALFKAPSVHDRRPRALLIANSFPKANLYIYVDKPEQQAIFIQLLCLRGKVSDAIFSHALRVELSGIQVKAHLRQRIGLHLVFLQHIRSGQGANCVPPSETNFDPLIDFGPFLVPL